MALKNVRLRNPDENNENSVYYYKTREVEITTDNGTFTTPRKLISKSEHNARNELPISMSLDQDMAIDFKLFDSKQMETFLKENGEITKNIRNARQFNQMTRRNKFKLSIFQPFPVVLNSLSLSNKEKFCKLQADFLQLRLNSSIISYPYLNLGYRDYVTFIDKYYPKNDSISAIFTLDMNMPLDTFKKILKHLVDKPGPKIIAIIYQDWEKFPLHHYEINSYFQKEDVAFLACQVDRELDTVNVSKLHSIQFDAFDLIALKQSRGFDPDPKIDFNKIKFISRDTLEINPISNVVASKNRDLISEFNIPKENYNDLSQLTKVINNYAKAADPVKFNTLIYLGKLHEAINSPPEFDVSRKFIKSGETEEYIKQKNGLENVSFLKRKH